MKMLFVNYALASTSNRYGKKIFLFGCVCKVDLFSYGYYATGPIFT